MSVTEELAEWAHQLTLAAVPAAVRDTACRHLLDGLGTAVAAARHDAAIAAVQVATGLGGPPEANVIGTAHRGSAVAAALANGTLVHALDFDDTHAGGLVHPTAVVLPVAFAVGQQVGADGAAVLAAALVGYEAACRIAAQLPQAFHARGAHPTSVCGVFAAAVTAAKLMALPGDQTAHALGIAASQSSGVMEFLHSGGDTKQLHPGWAAAAGIVAARLAAAGSTGPSRPLEGAYGVYQVFANTAADGKKVIAGLGEVWETTRITIKPYPACQLMHASLDAARRLRARLGGHEQLARLTVQVPPTAAAVVCEPYGQKLRPTTPYAAKFSLPWSVAAMLADGEVGLPTYQPAQLRRTDIKVLATRVRYTVAEYPGADADAPGRINATTVDGEHIEVDVPCSSGTPAWPLEESAVRAKAYRNLGGGTAAEALAGAVTGLGALPSLDPLLELAASCAATLGAHVKGGRDA